MSRSRSPSLTESLTAALGLPAPPATDAAASAGRDVAADSTTEVTAVWQEFRDAAARERERKDLGSDGEFLAVLVFPTMRHRDAFLAAMPAPPLLEDDPQYVDGIALAAHFHIPMPAVPRLPTTRQSKRWINLGGIGA